MSENMFNKRQELEARAEELVESWINGNRSYVYQQVKNTPILLAQIALTFNDLEYFNDSSSFLNYFINRSFD